MENHNNESFPNLLRQAVPESGGGGHNRDGMLLPIRRLVFAEVSVKMSEAVMTFP